MHRYTHHRGTQHAPMKYIAGLEHLEDGALFVFLRFRPVHGLVQVRVERLARRINALRSELCHVVKELFVDELKSPAVAFVFCLAVRGESMFEAVNHRYETFNQARRRTLRIFKALLLDPFAVIVEVRLPAKERLPQLVEVCGQLCPFRLGSNGLCFRGLLKVCALGVFAEIDLHFLVVHSLASPLPIRFQILLSASLKSCATYATAVMARS